MGKQQHFQSDLKITQFSSKCWYFSIDDQKTCFIPKKAISKSDLNKTSFFSKCGYVANFYMDKNDILKMISKNLLYPEIMIFTKIWTKITFFSVISKNVDDLLIFLDIWTKNVFFKVIWKQRYFPRSVDIFGHMDKKQLEKDVFWISLWKSCFCPYLWIYQNQRKGTFL